MCFEALAVAAAARALGNCFDNGVGGVRDRCRDRGIGGERRDRCDNRGVGGVSRDRCRRRDDVRDEMFRRGILPDMTVHRGDCCDDKRFDFCCRRCD